MCRSAVHSFKKSFFLVGISILIGACSQHQTTSDSTAEQLEDTGWVKLSLREKIGQVVCLNYNPTQINEVANGSIDTFLIKYPVGSMFIAGWMLRKGDSVSMADKYKNVVNRCAAITKYPMLFVEDFEQGLGSSIPTFTHLTSEMGLGATASKEMAYSYGDIIAREARSIGLNWLLHPVADLNVNPFHFLTNMRGLSDDPQLAIKMLPQQVKAMQNKNVAATAKHFPGDGADYINQHFNTTTMHLSYKEWQQQHGKVFQTLIEEGVMSIMAGHITFPDYQKETVDGEYLPATLSSELLTGLLKEEMGFKGVIVSDALNMGGCGAFFESQLEIEMECFKAGADVLLWPSLEFIDSLEARILRGEIPIERLNDAVSRVWNMKKKLGVFEDEYEVIEPLGEDEMSDNNKIAYNIAEASVTLLSNKHQLIPFNADSTKNILVLLVSENNDTSYLSPFKEELVANGYNVDIQHNFSFFNYAGHLDKLVEQYDKFIFAFYQQPGNPWGALTLNGDQALSMWTANRLPQEQVVSISFGDPYKNLIYMPRTWARINCYNADFNSQVAAARALTTNYSFAGISPVSYTKPF